MTCLLRSGLKYLIPQWWEFASYTDAKNKEMNLLNTRSPADVRGSCCCEPPAPCSSASCSWKTIRLADPNTSLAETPQSRFCLDRHKTPAGAETVGCKTNASPRTSPPFPQPLLSCPLPEDACSPPKLPEGEAHPSHACGCSRSGLRATRG